MFSLAIALWWESDGRVIRQASQGFQTKQHSRETYAMIDFVLAKESGAIINRSWRRFWSRTLANGCRKKKQRAGSCRIFKYSAAQHRARSRISNTKTWPGYIGYFGAGERARTYGWSSQCFLAEQGCRETWVVVEQFLREGQSSHHQLEYLILVIYLEMDVIVERKKAGSWEIYILDAPHKSLINDFWNAMACEGSMQFENEKNEQDHRLVASRVCWRRRTSVDIRQVWCDFEKEGEQNSHHNTLDSFWSSRALDVLKKKEKRTQTLRTVRT